MLNALYSILSILICLLSGYTINHTIGGLPASLYGMVIFTLLLQIRILNAERINASIAWGLKHMGVCFVPAGVGIINHYQLLKHHGIALVSITFVTTFIVLTFVGFYFQHIENNAKANEN
jgi:holin-like protein